MGQKDQQQPKSVTTDKRTGERRLRFVSNKERSAQASADVYRSKETIGVVPTTAISSSSISSASQFTIELDLALDRNTSELFQGIYNRLYPLSRSLPEILHHLPQLLDILLDKDEDDDENYYYNTTNASVLLLALPDILHLVGVLAKETREELHPHVHTKVLPRLLRFFSSSGSSNTNSSSLGSVILQHIPIVESIFRTISQILRYDTLLLAEEEKQQLQKKKKKSLTQSSTTSIRYYYGPTLGHKSPLLRRLAGQTFGLFLRKFHSSQALKKHIQQIFRSYILSVTKQTTSSTTTSSSSVIPNTMDGISWFFFYAVKGVPGQLHSKGIYILQIILQQYLIPSSNTNTDVEEDTQFHPIVFLISPLISSLFLKICNHINPVHFTPIWEILFQTLKDILQQQEEPKQQQLALKHILDLMEMCASFNNNCFLSTSPSSLENIILSTMETIFFTKIQSTTPTTNNYHYMDVKESILRLFCTYLKAKANTSSFTDRIPSLLTLLIQEDKLNNSPLLQDNYYHLLFYLAQHLLPHLPLDIALNVLVPTILQATLATALASASSSSISLVIIHTVATSLKIPRNHGETIEEEKEEEALFNIDPKLKFLLSSNDYQKLWNLCLYEIRDEGEEGDVERLIYMLRCIPLLFNGSSDDGDLKISQQLKQHKILSWLLRTLKVLDKRLRKQQQQQLTNSINTSSNDRLVVAKALLLELTSCVIAVSKEDKTITLILEEMYSSTQIFLKDYASSVWATRGTSYFLKAISNSTSLQAHHNSNMVYVDEIFDVLVPNLRQTNHYLRYYTLSILSSLPKKSYVVDHAEIDFSQDLDEEPSTINKTTTTAQPNNVFSGTCDLISILYSIETIPIHIDHERKLTSYINRVEVSGRSGKLPVVYIEAAANHMLGILSVKFAPIWPAATRAFAGLILSSPSTTIVEQLLDGLISKLESVLSKRTTLESTTPMTVMTFPLNNFADFYKVAVNRHAQLCTQWEQSKGTNIDLFRYDQTSHDEECHVLMPKSRCTDESTLLELVLGVMEAAPDIVAKNSKRFVPLFVGFLHYEYFATPSSPSEDARELCLSHHVEHYPQITNEPVQGKNILKKKLLCFLKVFAAISGPQQLYKHKLLSGIFFSLLSNPDPTISQLAFECLLRYKFVYLLPYKEHLHKLLKKGEMKDALLGLDLCKDSGILAAQHRQQFIPVLSRFLFGRLMAKGGGKSSKDTPKLRRRAILSFFSKLASNEGEVDYFIYLMVRAFIPAEHSMKRDYQEYGLDSSMFIVRQLTELVKAVTVQDVAKIRYQKHVGFLNLISDAISQLGYGIHTYIDVFMPILLSMCEYSALHPTTKLSETFDAKAEQEDSTITSEVEEDESVLGEGDTEIINANASTFNFSAIRSLCYQRLSQLFLQFAPSFNFHKYCYRMWAALRAAIENLPKSVVNAPHCPSLLRLLNDLSSDPNLIPLLAANPCAVEAAFKCIDVTSQVTVVEVSLSIVDQLLTEGGVLDRKTSSDDSVSMMGRSIVADHLHLLITQMSSRLCTRCIKQGSMGSLAKKELSILCQVSDLIDPSSLSPREAANNGRVKQETMDMLCNALVSFLDPERQKKEEVQVNILQILNNFLPSLSSVSAMKLFVPLSKLLGPVKTNAGIVSPEIRALIIGALDKVSVHMGSTLHHVVSALKCLHTYDSRHVGEYNFEVILPTLNRLGDPSAGEGNWESFVSNNEYDEWGAKIILPLLFHCLHTLYSSDGVLSRGAFKALKTFVFVASKTSACTGPVAKESGTQSFSRVLETSMMPTVRLGLHSKNDAVHRYFIQILCEVCKNFASSASPAYCGDLSLLIREDDVELDFFLNTAHVQIHRRARALARLRREYLGKNSESAPGTFNHECPFTQSSLSNILLPLALRPLYAEKPSEESYALEAVATVGAIARHLTWSKYDSAICDLLRQFPRFPNQERFFIGAICSILDAFHFDVTHTEYISMVDHPSSVACVEGDENNSVGPVLNVSSIQKADPNGAVWRALNQRIIPRTEQLLTKTLTDKSGSRIQQLRSPIALALTKLFQKLPFDVLLAKLPRLVLEVCTALRSKDSDCREIARETLAKMAASLGEYHLALILKHLATNLTEGYQLHVRSATLHSVLLSLSKVYNVAVTSEVGNAKSLPFDQCIPAIMDLIMQDLFGIASEMKEAEYVEKRLVKEAMGSKSVDSLEIICKCIYFHPSFASKSLQKDSFTLPSLSAVHNIIIPLLERLRLTDINSTAIGKIRECLTKVVVGLSQNPTVTTLELMPFVHAIVAPFLIGNAQLTENSDTDGEYSDAEDSDEDVLEQPLQVSRTGKDVKPLSKKIQRPNPVAQWHPSTLTVPTNNKSARALNTMQKREMQQVLDGDSAPKLTGKARHGYLDHLVANNLSDPSKACGVVFGLSLLHSCLKKSKVDSKDPQTLSMADPFVPMLTYCITNCENSDIILLSLKLLGHFLYWDLPSLKTFQKRIASNVLKLLSQVGGVLSSKHEVTHGCFKALTLLFDKHVLSEDSATQLLASPEVPNGASIGQENPSTDSKRDSKDENRLPLNQEQMKVLVSMLLLSVTDTEHHNSTFSLIKAIVSRRFLSAEFYDLMEKLLELSVQSLKAGVRQHASNIFMKFLLTYPLDHKRLLQHLQQIVLNIKYEYEEGRLSGIKLLDGVIGKLPIPLLKKHGNIFFFPLILQLVNDESNSCREAVAHVITCLFQRSSMEQLQLYYDYMKQWFLDEQGSGASLRRTSAQLLGLFVESRADFFVGRKNKVLIELVEMIQRVLSGEVAASKVQRVDQFGATTATAADQWETAYFCLVCFEKVVQKSFFPALSPDVDTWAVVIDCLVFPHPWVKQVSCRILWSYLQGLDTKALEDTEVDNTGSTTSSSLQSPPSFLVRKQGSLFQIAKNVCIQLNFTEDQYNEALVVLNIKILTWISQRMCTVPQLCYKEGEELEVVEFDKRRDPLLWLFTRLANMCKEKGNMRRSAIFKCFASIVTAISREDGTTITPYLQVMLEALHRAVAEVEGASMNNVGSSYRTSAPLSSLSESASDLPKEVMNLLEERCGTEAFLLAYSNVKMKAREKKMARKQQIVSEAILDPKEAAKRKIRKQSKEKERRKRKIQERRASRGVFTKKPRI